MDQLDFSQLYCKAHPYELVNNFCNDERCLIGLCATCVCSHTEMHARNATVPQYQNIKDTFAALHEETRQQIIALEDSQDKLARLREAVEVKKITIRRTIKDLRQEALSKVKEEFDFLEKKIMADINNEQKKQGFHSSLRFQTLAKNLTKQIEVVLGSIQCLNSKDFLETAKKLKSSGLQEREVSRFKIDRELSDNEIYTANLKWNLSYKTQLSNTLKKMFTLEFIVPKSNGQKQSWLTIVTPQQYFGSSSRPSSQSKLSNTLLHNSSMMNLSHHTTESMKGSRLFTTTTPFNNSSLMRHSVLRRDKDMSESRTIGTEKENTHSRNQSLISSVPSTPTEVITRQSLIHKLGAVDRSSKIRLF